MLRSNQDKQQCYELVSIEDLWAKTSLIALQAVSHRMVGGRVLISDSTHLKANANKHMTVQNMKKIAFHLERKAKEG